MTLRAVSGERGWINDPFMVCLAIVLAFHVLLFFGITFGFDLKPAARLPDTLDVVLVQWRSEKEPKHADYLAQASQKGGGETTERARPTEPVSGTLPLPAAGKDSVQSTGKTTRRSVEQRKVITVKAQEQPSVSQNAIEQPEQAQPDAARLMQQSLNMAALRPELNKQRQWHSHLPRRKFISANTRKYEFASYMNAWVSKVERVGNMNYPTELRRRKLRGDLVLTVGINRDGSVESIDLMRSSGVPEIDKAAINIVHMAAPYAPLPPNISDHIDVLHITRTWRFESAFGVE